jgi:dephospho-CoA kinase
MDILKIALTGGIACGKSQMAQVFAELGADVVRVNFNTQTVIIY